MIAAYAALAGFEIWSGLQQAEIIKGQSELTRNISEMNARYAELDAWEAEKYGYTEAARYQTVVDQTIGEQRAGYAAENVDVNFGTAKEVQQESKLTGFLNQLDIQRKARAKAMGLKFEASNYRLSASMQEIQGNVQASAARTAGITRGLSTAASGYGAYLGDLKKADSSTPSRQSTSNASSTGQMQPMTSDWDVQRYGDPSRRSGGGY